MIMIPHTEDKENFFWRMKFISYAKKEKQLVRACFFTPAGGMAFMRLTGKRHFSFSF